MDLYLPDEFYALTEAPNARRDHKPAARDERDWLGGEAFIAAHSTAIAGRKPAEPDPIWLVV
jgi:hypothetical protein